MLNDWLSDWSVNQSVNCFIKWSSIYWVIDLLIGQLIDWLINYSLCQNKIIKYIVCLFQFIIIFSWADYHPARYGDDYKYPMWADIIGWLMSVFTIMWIPIVAIYKLCREEGTLTEVRINKKQLPKGPSINVNIFMSVQPYTFWDPLPPQKNRVHINIFWVPKSPWK